VDIVLDGSGIIAGRGSPPGDRGAGYRWSRAGHRTADGARTLSGDAVASVTERTGPTADEAGFRSWAEHRRASLRRTAYLICGDWHLADDAVQDTLTSIYTRWRRIASGGRVEAYARRVLVNALVDVRRRPWRRERVTETLPEREDLGQRCDLDRPLDRQVLVEALGMLAAGQRAVLVLRFWEDLPVDQVADLLGVSPGTVKSQTSRALDRMRTVLGAEDQPAHTRIPTTVGKDAR